MRFNLFVFIFMMYESIHTLNTGMLGYELYGSFYIGKYKYIVSLVFLLFGLYSLYHALKLYKYQKKNGKPIEYSKCPKCKESYEYINLKDGICPKCKIKTIDMEKYYEK